MNAPVLKSAARTAKALADPQRMRILYLLRPGERCVCQIVAVLALAPSTVSKHLSLLEAAGLVASRKDGRWIYYRLPERTDQASAQPLLDWLYGTLRRDPAVAADARKLKSIDARSRTAGCRPNGKNP